MGRRHRRKIKKEARSSLDIERLLETLQKHNIYDKEETNFTLRQFDRTQKATDWILEYETEYEKLEIQNEEKKIKCLKMYLEKIALEWYQTNTLKNKEYNWEDWKTSFLKVLATSVGLQHNRLISKIWHDIFYTQGMHINDSV